MLSLKPPRGWGALEEQPLGEVWVLPEQVPAQLFVPSSRCFLQTALLHPAAVGRENPHLASAGREQHSGRVSVPTAFPGMGSGLAQPRRAREGACSALARSRGPFLPLAPCSKRKNPPL